MSKVVEETKMETRQTRKTAPSANPAGFPTKTSEKVRSIVSHHVKSFDYLVDTGVELAVKDIRPMTVAIVDESTDKVNKLTYWMENPTFGRPTKREGDALDPRLFPSECRGRGITYTSPLYTTFAWTVNDGDKHTMSFHVGDIPIMVGSKLCHLNGLTPKQLVRHGEDPHEFGGYFICNGIERCIRMLQVPRRNHVVAIERPSFANRGRKYTSKATMIRSVRSVRACSVRTRSARMSSPSLMNSNVKRSRITHSLTLKHQRKSDSRFALEHRYEETRAEPV